MMILSLGRDHLTASVAVGHYFFFPFFLFFFFSFPFFKGFWGWRRATMENQNQHTRPKRDEHQKS
ncbi:hypothetical protein BDV38DRAFT_211219 [Aspergillus pseudotamarii]|uniref:Uncharacterized protein n=1 Tax=Aspergillus pseudotamarii TaxID=132259 RepID=A0A5N6SFB4_ASPPS|nr:uncharacterized protein BDV38DRAFT_211219 [Aspergillus pseudotamarii]KAE8132371.1 hypothetical protein BDV38DRAFT_211219 [Aspergillus pseudotamarii]